MAARLFKENKGPGTCEQYAIPGIMRNVERPFHMSLSSSAESDTPIEQAPIQKKLETVIQQVR